MRTKARKFIQNEIAGNTNKVLNESKQTMLTMTNHTKIREASAGNARFEYSDSNF
jgi:hypothetical protein